MVEQSNTMTPMSRESIINAVNMEVAGIDRTKIPMHVLPTEVQSIITDYNDRAGFTVEYLIPAILSATATAIGNTHWIRLKDEWKVSPFLYVILVGRPGSGKSPSTTFAYQPVKDFDDANKARYEAELNIAEQKEKVSGKTLSYSELPKSKRIVVKDFTEEALIEYHYKNPRGIVVLVDEVLGMFKTLGRYSGKSDFVEKLASVHSGDSFDPIRKGERHIKMVKHPCLNLIGSVQFELIEEIMDRKKLANGFIDRVYFIWPTNTKMKKWSATPPLAGPSLEERWKTIINKLLQLELEFNDDGSIKPVVVNMTPEAQQAFFKHHNDYVDAINEIEDDRLVDTRIMKSDYNIGRLALIIQMLRWASGEAEKDFVDAQSMESAIVLHNYFEESYRRIVDSIQKQYSDSSKELLYEALPDEFMAKDAIAIANNYNISERSLYRCLDDWCRMSSRRLTKTGSRKSATYHKAKPMAVKAVGS